MGGKLLMSSARADPAESTIEQMAAEVVSSGAKRVACISTPSIFFALPKELRETSFVLDFDRQWEAKCPGFVFYDFNEPEAVPEELKGTCDYLVVDPPFVTREVWEKYAATVKLLAAPGAKFLLSSIHENSDMLRELLGVEPQVFQPSIPNLIYQYDVYANYETKEMGQRNPEIFE